MKTILAIDVGYGNTKAVWNRRDQNGKVVWDEICFPSAANKIFRDHSIQGIAGPDRVLVDVDGELFFVGPEATAGAEQLVGGIDYIAKPEYEALLCGAWSYMMKRMGRVIPTVDSLVLGLPVANFVVRRSELMAIGAKTHKVPVPESLKHGIATLSARALDVHVIPQPYGAMRLAHELSADEQLASAGFAAMVIDPGYGTLDWFVTKGLAPRMELSDSFEGGVRMILKEVASIVGKDHGGGSPNMSLVARGLQDGFMLDAGKRIDMAPYMNIVDQVANTLTAQFLQRFDPRKEGIHRVILAGGGAKYFSKPLADQLPEFQIETLDASLMSNARGFWLHGMDKQAH
jgi:plasmid segregation protein ParM